MVLAFLAIWICKGGVLPQGKAQLVVDDAWINLAIWSKDGSRVITFGEGGPRVWDPVTGDMLYALKGDMYYPANVHLSPDGSRVIAYGKYVGAPEWDVATGELIHTYGNVYLQISSAWYSNDSSKVFTTDDDGRSRVWDDRTGKLIEVIDGKPHRPLIGDFSNAGSLIPIQGRKEHTTDVVDLKTGLVRYSVDDSDDRDDEHFSPDGRLIVGVVRKADEFKRDRLVTFPGHIKLWDSQTGKAIRTLGGHVDDLSEPQYSPNGRYIAAADAHSIKVWMLATGKLLRSFGNPDWVAQECRFSPDSKTLAAGMLDKTVVLWDIATGKLLHRMRGHTLRLLTVRFSPDGKRLLSASKDGTARIWDVHSGRLIQVLQGFTFENLGGILKELSSETPYRQVEYQPSGALGAVLPLSKQPRATYAGGYLEPWEDVRALCPNVRSSNFTGARLSPDKKRVVTRLADRAIKLWDVRSGRLLHNLGVQTGEGEFAFFSQDGTRVATNDGTFRFWDLKTGQFLYRTLSFRDDTWLTISRDGRYDSSEGAHPRHGHFALRIPTGALGIPFSEVVGTRYYVPNLADRINRGTYSFQADSPLINADTSTDAMIPTASAPSTAGTK